MADLKISELVSATSVAVTDYLVIVQSGETRKITPSVFFSNLPIRPICNELPETVANGTISNSVLTTLISFSSSANQNLTLAAGVHGMEKEIIASAISMTYRATVTVSNAKGFSTIVFDQTGQSVKLKNISGFWYVVGSQGVLIA